MNRIRLLLFIIISFRSGCIIAQNFEGNRIALLSDICVYSNNNHAAFTSLEEFGNKYYLAFREAGSHHSTSSDKGKIRIMTCSRSNNKWSTQQVLSKEGWDLRDPCLVKWGNKLLIYTSYHYSELTDKGWTELKEIKHNAPHHIYIWKIRPYKDCLYGIGNSGGQFPLLMKSIDGINWVVVDEYLIGGEASEADLLFVGNKLYICFRIEKPDGAHSMWGVSKYPFTEMKWTKMDVSIASPELMQYSNRTIMLAGRECYFNKDSRNVERRVSIFALNKKGLVKEHVIVKEGDEDLGYCSFSLINKRNILMSYYTGNQQTSIHLLSFSYNE